ncbi:MAG: hypothetical protein BMS9Abin29_0921 [Gemmatimonadota bacterium]|nr:MAG: hypothetical protein BMS9Abin29_0921 [Gemmatimonadota bacterium]
MGGKSEGILDLELGRIGRKPRRHWLKLLRVSLKIGFFALKVVLVLALPFVLLVRGSVYFYQEWGLHTWTALGSGVVVTILLFLIYASWLWRRMTGKRKVPRLARRVLMLAVGGYAAYALLFLSAANVKTPELRDYYTSLHPLLRLGSSTFLLFDREAVITDMRRTPEAYLKMGLPINETSLHFKLEDKYVHAMDLRTVGRPGWRNYITDGYFRSMGFRTLRHVGTADHLHVSLPLQKSSP